MKFGINNFSINGFAILKHFFSKNESNILLNFTKNWISENINNSIEEDIKDIVQNEFNLENYSEFINKYSFDHNKVAAAKYRYKLPNQEIISIIRNEKIMNLVSEVSKKSSFIIWQDPGFGWLGYRIIRPQTNDGYPPSCKNWGAAAGVYSLWLPIAGCNNNSSIRFLPGSHLKQYKKFLPQNSKFTKGEFRLAEDIPEDEFIRLNCELGDAIIYHPATIHSEDSDEKVKTRINLEYRFMPEK